MEKRHWSKHQTKQRDKVTVDSNLKRLPVGGASLVTGAAGAEGSEGFSCITGGSLSGDPWRIHDIKITNRKTVQECY